MKSTEPEFGGRCQWLHGTRLHATPRYTTLHDFRSAPCACLLLPPFTPLPTHAVEFCLKTTKPHMKQVTLSRVWQPKAAHVNDEVVIDSDDEDQFLVQAMDNTLAALDPPCGAPLEELPGFDVTAGKTWIYPTNYPVREYQFNIVKSCLFNNTLVILPTGLAPTKPLVSQQIEACFNVMGIPLEDTIEMTGTMQAEKRKKAWRERRVFFLTPQVMANDLLRGACLPKDVKCVVIDEAHKALGNYAYCQVVSELTKYTREFRVIALSATPGSDIAAVYQVVKNLLISHVELRTEESLDIQRYTQDRTIEKVVVPLGQQLGLIKDRFLGVIGVYLQRLSSHGAVPSVDPGSLGKFRILKMKEAFQANPPVGMAPATFGQLQADFGLLISLYHAYELLLAHGLRSFCNFLKGVLDGDKSNPRARYQLLHNTVFRELFSELQETLGTSLNETLTPNGLNESIVEDVNQTYGHPKLAKLEEIVLEHFRRLKNGTRVMIFSQYRDSVKEITTLLNRHRPLVKAMNFVGQNTTRNKGFTQKQQIMVVKRFREGGYNTLVSTCVGEEGLDIGDIDLIICYDAPKSPIRLVQRMGRTGRKRQGRIVVLLTQGKEEQAYRQSNYKKQSIHRAISSGAQFKNLYSDAPRMVPRGLNPVCHRMYMSVHEYQSTNHKAMLTGKEKTLLTTEEQLYFEAHFEMPNDQWPHISQPRFLTLRKNNVCEGQLSLSRWTPWQNMLQPTFKVKHSSKAKVYVHVMQVIDNLRLVGPEPFELTLKHCFESEDVQQEQSRNETKENKSPRRRRITDFFDDDFESTRAPQLLPPNEDDLQVQENALAKMQTLEMIFRAPLDEENDDECRIEIWTPPPLESIVFSHKADGIFLDRKESALVEKRMLTVHPADKDVLDSINCTFRSQVNINSHLEDLVIVPSKPVKDESSPFLDDWEQSTVEQDHQVEIGFIEGLPIVEGVSHSTPITSPKVSSLTNGKLLEDSKELFQHAQWDKQSRSKPDLELEVDLSEWDDEMPSCQVKTDQVFRGGTLSAGSGSDDDCPVGKAPHQRKRKVINRLVSSEDESQDAQRNPTKKKKAPCKFLEDEAEVSSGASEDDSEGSSLDSLDGSFIDDEEETSSPIEAFYMQSTKSFIQQGQFKIGYRASPLNDVYSQVVSQDISDYLQDSFCVKEDEIPKRQKRNKSRRQLVTSFHTVRVPYSINYSQRTSRIAQKKVPIRVLEEPECLQQELKLEQHRCQSGTAEGSMLVIADTRVIVSNPALVSGLRSLSGLTVQVRSLSAGDFQLSHRMGVICVSHLTSRDLLQHVRRLFDLYDRPCIILEHNPHECPTQKKRHFYVTLLQLVSTHAKVLLSASQDNTVLILTALARQEERKGMAIPVLPQLKDLEEMIPFYLAVPKVNLGVAISLAARYRSIMQFLQSTVEDIQRTGKVSNSRSQEIVSFCCKASKF
ncbi:Fanconi anemia group M protein homolog isoform X2 [Ornithodoros turicata]|uniref:Fanconi anemia group M protein homolog isoform X2 n=1 Tax=Ornithodoros turicata TaxID=34597 RepID=UPI00313A4BA2